MENCIKLKIWLMKNKISQSKISKETGLHKNTLSNLLKTGKSSKSVKELTRLYLQINKEEFESLLELD